jgi:hypothetical protein
VLKLEIMRLAREAYDRDGVLPSFSELSEIASQAARRYNIEWSWRGEKLFKEINRSLKVFRSR